MAHLRLTGNGNAPPPPLRQRMRWWSVTQWLIAVNVAVYVVQEIGGDRLTALGTFRIDAALHRLQLWRWVTTAFLHADPVHLLANMIGLWYFGPPVEFRLGRPRFLAFYGLSGLGGVLGYLLLWRIGLLNVTPTTELLGASGCIFGLVVAAAHIAPNRVVRWLFPPVDLRFVTLCWIYVGWAVLNVAHRGPNAGGDAAHLGGAAVGFVLIRNPSWLAHLRLGPRPRRFWKPGDPASHFFRRDA